MAQDDEGEGDYIHILEKNETDSRSQGNPKRKRSDV